MTHHSDLDLQGFVARALLAILEGKVAEAERPTLRDSKQFPYHEEAYPDLLLIETRFGHNFNMSQRFVLYGEERRKALWRLSIDTWWDEQTLTKWGLVSDALIFLDDARKQGYRLNRVVGMKNRELIVSEKPATSFSFHDNGSSIDFTRFIGDQSIKLRVEGHKDAEIFEAYYQGGRL